MGVSDPKIAVCQISTTIFGLIVLGCLAVQVTYRKDPVLREKQSVYPQPFFDDQPKGYWYIYGSSAHAMVFIMSSISVYFGIVSIFTPDPLGSLIESTFFWVLHAASAAFYFAASISLFVYCGTYASVTEPRSYSAAAFALFAAMGHTATAVLSKGKEKD